MTAHFRAASNSAKSLLAQLTLLALLLGTQRASAQSANERTLAEALFREGRDLMTQGHYAEACPKFAESHRLDPGGGTLLNLAVCHEREGKLASAWAEFQEALALARSDGRQDRVVLAEEHIEKLEPKLARLTVSVTSSAPADLSVTVRGTPLGTAAWGSAVPIDAGSAEVRATAPGRREFVKTIQIRDGKSHTLEVPELAPLDGAGHDSADSASGVGAEQEPNHAAAYVIGGIGVTSLALGSYFGVRALQDHSEAEDGCGESKCNTTAAAQADESAVFNGWMATAGIAAGVAAIGVAIYLYTDGSPTASEQARHELTLVPTATPERAELNLYYRY